jgi:4-hydroxy 2-oxovalerate aldolase
MKKNITLIDCTLRDGGYYNNWDFSTSLVNSYINSVHKSGVDYIEIGFRSFVDQIYKGPCAYSSDYFLSSLNIPKKVKIGVMVNGSDILNYRSENVTSNIKKLFPKKKNIIKFIRVACHLDEFKKVVVISRYLKKEGYLVIFNLMQCSERSEEEIIKIGEIAAKYPIDVLYFADSMGGMSPSQITRIMYLLRLNWKKDIGIHTHDNMGRAFANIDQAVREGVSWIDGTVMGMGRGPGNAKTEYLLINYQEHFNKKIDLLPILNLIDVFFKPLHSLYDWGTNVFYFLSGKYGIHPTFIQDILKDNRYLNSDKLLFIDHLRKYRTDKFDKSLLDVDKKLYFSKIIKNDKKKWTPSKILYKKNLLIIGNSPEIRENLNFIESFIKKEKPIVFGLNTQKTINEKLINYRVVCNIFRLLTDKQKYKFITTPFIIPLERLENNILKYLSKNKLLNFDLRVSNEKFQFKKNSVVCPNSLVISYALAIAASGNVSNIILAGFGGYNVDDPRYLEMQRTFSLFRSSSKIKITSLTPTKYSMLSNISYVKN